MIERLPGIYEIELTSDQGVTTRMHVFLIPGADGERSLMIDAGYRRKSCLQTMEKAFKELGISCDQLDIFLTHKHHDHTGLVSVFAGRGARVFMNQDENRHQYDCLYYNLTPEQNSDQNRVIKSAGVTCEKTPELWNMFMEARRRAENRKGWAYEIADFKSLPVTEGQIFSYGDYRFEAVSLRGHTYGQMGIFERNKRFLFSADQIIDGIVPIVGTSFPDEHLLELYFDSLRRLKHEYGDCLLLPAHEKPIRDVKRVADRIIFSYLDKTDMIKRILDHSRKKMTVREIACVAYGMNKLPGDVDEFVKLKMVMSKTFSCLEYLRDEDFVIRTEEDGTFYWQSAQA